MRNAKSLLDEGKSSSYLVSVGVSGREFNFVGSAATIMIAILLHVYKFVVR